VREGQQDGALCSSGYRYAQGTGIQGAVKEYVYCIVGNFSGVQFSPFSQISGHPRILDPRNMYDCTVYMYNRHYRTHPRKLNRKNIEDWPFAKIGPHENFTLYGSLCS
jgi:hypothetical protein